MIQLTTDKQAWDIVEQWRREKGNGLQLTADLLGITKGAYSAHIHSLNHTPIVNARGLGILQAIADITGNTFVIRPLPCELK